MCPISCQGRGRRPAARRVFVLPGHRAAAVSRDAIASSCTGRRWRRGGCRRRSPAAAWPRPWRCWRPRAASACPGRRHQVPWPAGRRRAFFAGFSRGGADPPHRVPLPRGGDPVFLRKVTRVGAACSAWRRRCRGEFRGLGRVRVSRPVGRPRVPAVRLRGLGSGVSWGVSSTRRSRRRRVGCAASHASMTAFGKRPGSGHVDVGLSPGADGARGNTEWGRGGGSVHLA